MAKSTREIITWVAEIFEAPAEDIRLETKREEIPAWDSLGILTLMARMDEDFHVLPTEEEIDQMRSVSDIIDVLRKHSVVEDSE